MSEVTDFKIEESQALIHGGAMLVYRIHITLLDLKQYKKQKDYEGIYQELDWLYLEIYPWLNKDEHEDLFKAHKEFLINKNDWVKNKNVPTIHGNARLFEMGIRKALARLDLLMKPEDRKKYAAGAMY